jgi:hypothetical protein
VRYCSEIVLPTFVSAPHYVPARTVDIEITFD